MKQKKNNILIMQKFIKNQLKSIKNLLYRVWIIRASINLIDYVYYRIYLVCTKYIKQDVKEACATMLMLSIIVTPLLVSQSVFLPALTLKDHEQDTLYLLLFIPLFIRYLNKDNYARLQERWKYETEKQKKIRGRIILSVWLLSNVIYPIIIIIWLISNY